MKNVTAVYPAPRGHWVGDGFPVRSLFSYSDQGQALSPFLLLDYAGPANFPAKDDATHPRGVGEHPHRGFETVTIVYDGEVAHRDSTGQGGVIGPGDVQWMTAGAGIMHEEFHSPDYSRRGGAFEMVQLWVNLPAAHKMTAPGYQGIVSDSIPAVALPDGAGQVRVIAGNYNGNAGPAHTFTPMSVWDVKLREGASVSLPQTEGWTSAVVVLHGQVRVNGASASSAQLVVLGHEGSGISIKAESDAVILLLAGEPINEPIVGYGPFVMNTREEISQAMADVSQGRFGHIHH